MGGDRVEVPLIRPRRFRAALGAALTLVLASAGALVVSTSASAAVDPCGASSNAIVCENSKPGTSRDVWDVDGVGDPAIQGFATDISTNVGQQVRFKIKTTAANYSITIYRLGWYDGDGARQIDTVTPSATLPQIQPACVTSATTEIYDCGTWGVSASWTVPANAVSGVYIARLQRPGAGDGSHIPFIVRNDASHSALFFQTSDTTWQAYNDYGGSDFYTGGDNGRAYKISYNRPFATRGGVTARDFLFSNEYPTIRFLEQNGYDVSYTTGVDSDRRGALIRNHQVFLSVGHDEYWSGTQRANVEAARDAGVHLAFFSGNEVYWKTRWENSVDGSGTASRTLVCYKETWANDKIDPSGEWTGTWRDPRFSPPSNGGKPENGLTGTMFQSNNASFALQVPAAQGKLRFWRGTSVAGLGTDQTATLAPNTVGYESDEDIDNGFRPAGLIRMSTTTHSTPEYLRDFGTLVTPGTTTHSLTLYRAPSGALVFGAGTIQWGWGLDEEHDGVQSPPDRAMQQATVNLLTDMGVTPLTVMSTLSVLPGTNDTTAPTVTVTSPASGATVANGAAVTVTGTASDTGGRVAGVEVSTDGSTWHPATGTTSWTYSFFAAGLGSQTVRVRAIDDNGNIQQTPATRALTLTGKVSVFGGKVPENPDVSDSSPVEVGMKVIPQTSGYISGIRFYKGTGNTGTHTGTLWSAAGTELATGTFRNETASGWQTLTFQNAVPVAAGTTYVASYYAPNGHYAADPYAFTSAGITSGPLVAPRSSASGGNGVYADGGGFPNSTWQDSNYYVDVLFVDTGNSAPVVVASTPAADASGIATSVNPAAVFSKSVVPSSVQFTLKEADGTTVAGSKAYDDATRTTTFTPTAALSSATGYDATVQAADQQGNTVTYTWSFTTDVDASVARLFPSTMTPATPAASDSSAVSLGTKFVPASSGEIVGIRFYQGPGNSGSHTGTLWSATGSQLRKVTFPSSATVGWQTALFDSPVAVTGGTTYVVSYFAPNGRYAITTNFFNSAYSNGPLSAPSGVNGLFVYGSDAFPQNSYQSSNYWVDALFVPGGGGDPTPTPTTPSPTPTTPTPLPEGAQTVFATDAVPANASWNDGDALEVGLQFRSDVAGKALGVRFYKGPGNTGTHTGTLWTNAGQQVATGTFSGETASGWQNMLFSTPVTLTPNTWYVVSYHTTAGHYAVDGNAFGASGVDNPPLHVPSYAARYLYGAGGAFPGSGSAHNYWVDVIFKSDA
ncbi:Ig-like domain-containing protein [Pseudosporangium ferrugineum]|uniref:Ig-like domain-containing protein n=1 Tax=Pseudosporangium ferrugineum TaxID=439699 RepID=A0A2T0SF48_9ACTN|nr:Ig-like domain-containing protein [Pseudosporangium ferrugineum]